MGRYFFIGTVLIFTALVSTVIVFTILSYPILVKTTFIGRH